MSEKFNSDRAVELYTTTYEREYAAGHAHTRAKRAGKAAVEGAYPDVNWQDHSFTGRLPSLLVAIRNRIDRDDTPPMLAVPRPDNDDSGGSGAPRPSDVMRQWFEENDELVFMPKFVALATGYSRQAHMNYLYASQDKSLINEGYVIEVTRSGGVVRAVCTQRPAPPVDEKVSALLEIAHGAGFTPEQIEQIKALL